MVRFGRFESKNSQKWVLKNPHSEGDTTTVSPPSDRKRLYINHLVKFFRKLDFQIFSFGPLLEPDHNLKHPFFAPRYGPRSAFHPPFRYHPTTLGTNGPKNALYRILASRAYVRVYWSHGRTPEQRGLSLRLVDFHNATYSSLIDMWEFQKSVEEIFFHKNLRNSLI